MTIERHLYTPHLITEGNITFEIPLYQRLFAWSANEVEQLLQDLEYHFSTKNDERYYLGIITQIEQNGKMVLIDGQQRFTVMILLGIALSHDHSGWRQFIDNGNRLKLFARPDDQGYLSRLASSGGVKKAETGYVNKLMSESYGKIEKFLENFAGGRLAFGDNIFNNLTILASTLPQAYLERPESLNLYFENMNSAGKSLEQHEVLKASLLIGHAEQTKPKLLAIWKCCEDFSKPLLAENTDSDENSNDQLLLDFLLGTAQNLRNLENSMEDSDSFKTIFEIQAERKDFTPKPGTNCESIINFPQFLLLSLDLFTQSKINGESEEKGWAFYRPEKLVENFKILPESDIEKFYDFMLRIRAILDYFVIRRDEDGIYSLRYKGQSSLLTRAIAQYQAMLHVSTSYYTWLKDFIAYIDNELQNGIPDAKAILHWLKEWDNKKRLGSKKPSEIINAENMRYDTIDRYWFWRLDYYLWETAVKSNKEEDKISEIFPHEQIKAVKAYIFRPNRSIEHLQPQNQTRAETEWKDVDFFGNLAMISPSFNSLQSNEDVHVKFSRVETHLNRQALQSLKLLKMYNMKSWTEENAGQHEKEMLAILEKSFTIDDNWD